MSHLSELVAKLKEIFQIDRADLDFGIYRILNTRSQEIERYLSETLPHAVKQVFGNNQSEQLANWKSELEQAKKQAQELGIDPNQSPKVQDLQNKIAVAQKSTGDNETAVYRHLLTFFGRYYEAGDFISQRRYKGDTYAVPYAGEEVLLHWANKDQYYTKSGENFSNYRFKLQDGREVLFRIHQADTAKDNQKDNKAKRFFVLAEDEQIEYEDENGEIITQEIQSISETNDGQTLQILFNYVLSKDGKQSPSDKERGTDKDTSLNTQTLKSIFANPIVIEKWQEIQEIKPTEGKPNRTLLEKHLTVYTQKNTADYFIHKDLGKFLRRELDFYIKNEVMHLDDIQSAQAFAHIEANLHLIQTLRQIALKIIDFLAQLENFQKKLWQKKKFVAGHHYLITLNHILQLEQAGRFIEEIANNSKQLAQWQSLFNLPSADAQVFLNAQKANIAGGKTPLNSNGYDNLQHLVVDTSLFSATFQAKLLSALSAELSDGLDKHINGILIHSDNFQALNLLQARYREQVKCIYIDPPYNTGEDGFIYKDSYQHSSWLSMFENRLHLAYPLLTSDGNQFCSIDDVEEENAKLIFNSIFKKENFEAIIWKKKGGAGNTEKILGCLTEYILCYFKNKTAGVFNYRSVERNYAYKDEIGFYNLEGIEKTNLGAYERPTMLFDIIDPETNIAFRPSENNRWTIGYKTIYGDENSNTVGYIKQNRLYFDYKTNKVYLIKRPEHYENSENVYYNLLLEHGSLSVAKDEIKKLVGNREIFSTPKPVNLITTLLEIATKPNSTILDYFAGSGTTAHAVINLNREDNGKRQYILVEQGEYFDTVLKPRVQKVIYSKAWKDGKPVVETGADNLQGVPQIVKVLKLESYEDTLNNLELHRSGLFDNLSEDVQQDYLLHYMLDIESRDSLLNVSHFAKPFDYQLKIATNSAGAFDEKNIDLVETFNYLIGATVIGINDKRSEQGFVAVECHLPNQHTDEKTLIFWRDCERIGYDELQQHFDRLGINPADSEYSQVYVNGDHTLETVWDGEQSGNLKIRSIETEFLALMFVGDE